MEQTSSPRQRLAASMDARREDLRLTWAQVAQRAGVSRETLRQIRLGEGDIRPLTRRGIEDALKWAPGSVGVILAGDEPTPAEPSAPAAVSAEPEGEGPPASRHGVIEALLDEIEGNPELRNRFRRILLAESGQEGGGDDSDESGSAGGRAS